MVREEEEEEEEEEEQQLLYIDLDESNSSNSDNPNQTRRQICSNGCGRPSNVCLCRELPTQPISTSSHVVILHHPHELHHKLATVPLLSKCLLNTQTIIGRRLSLGSSPLLDSLYHSSNDPTPQSHRAVFLFPSTPDSNSVELDQWVCSNSNQNVVLIVFDGTWKHAKEMVKASRSFLMKFATQVCFSCDVGVDGGNIFDSELILRKEPFSGCMSTLEAVARSLRVLEPCGGVEIEEKLVAVLKAMVRFQALNLNKPVRYRPKLSRKVRKQTKDGDFTM